MKNGPDSLDLLSMNLQHHFNQKIQEILQDFNEKFFEPAIKNIKINTNETTCEKQVNIVLIFHTFPGYFFI